MGNTPGVTKSVQEVHLDKQVTLLDSPGVVFSTAGADGEAAAALRNCVKVRAWARGCFCGVRWGWGGVWERGDHGRWAGVLLCWGVGVVDF